jgi:beta-lactamase class A
MERAFGMLWSRPVHYEQDKRAFKYFSKIMWLSMVAICVVASLGMFWVNRVVALVEEVPTTDHQTLSSTSTAATPPTNSAIATPISQQTDEQLEQVINEWVAKHENATWSVVVERLDTGQTASYNASQTYDPASIYKLYATYALSQKLPFERWATENTTNGKTYQECIDAMLRYSDNPCGEAIGSQIGWGYIDKTIHQAGFSATFLNRNQGMLTTSTDTADFLKRLEQGTLVSDEVRNNMLASLKAQKYRKGIPAGCAGCEIFNKTGERDGFLHDTAIIHTSGHSYVLAIFSRGGSYTQIADLTGKINQVITAP